MAYNNMQILPNETRAIDIVPKVPFSIVKVLFQLRKVPRAELWDAVKIWKNIPWYEVAPTNLFKIGSYTLLDMLIFLGTHASPTKISEFKRLLCAK